MTKFIHLLVLLFSVSITAQNGYELMGTITDKATQKPLYQATIYIKELKKGTTTTAQGVYHFQHLPQGTYTVEFSYLGYRTYTKKIAVKGSTRFDVALKEETQEIAEVVLSAKSKAHLIKEQSMPVSVIDISSLRGTVSSVQDILAKTVGITLRTSGGVGSSSRISVRGLEGKRIGFFIE